MLPFLMVAVAVTGLAAAFDYRTGRIPNWLTLGGIATAVLGHFGYGWAANGFQFGVYQAAFSLGGALFCALAPAIMFWKGGMGGGDVKLFAAVGALCHPMLGIEAQLYSLVLAALIAPARLAYEGKLFFVLKGSLGLLFNGLRAPAERTEPPAELSTWFRLGPAIFIGTLATVTSNLFALLATG
jgi:prepilin peptidase CpaA